MVTATYIAVVQGLNAALATAGVTTFSFTHATNTVIGSKTYPNLISYLGYYLDSDSFKINSIVATELAKNGAWTVVKSPARPVPGIPADPAGDHYTSANGYHLSNTDLPVNDALDTNLKQSAETSTKSHSAALQGAATSAKYTIIDQVATVVMSAPDIAGNRTITSTVTININRPPA